MKLRTHLPLILIAAVAVTSPGPAAHADERNAIEAELLRLGSQLGGTHREHIGAEGYRGRPLGRTHEEEAILDSLDERAREDDYRRFQALQNRADALDAADARREAAAARARQQAMRAQSDRAYSQVMGVFESQSRRMEEDSRRMRAESAGWRAAQAQRSRIAVQSAEEFFQRSREQVRRQSEAMRRPTRNPAPVYMPPPAWTPAPLKPITPSPRPPQRSPLEAFNEGRAAGEAIGSMLQGIIERPKRKRKEAILQRYANGTITAGDYRQLVADGHVDLAAQLLQSERMIEQSGR